MRPKRTIPRFARARPVAKRSVLSAGCGCMVEVEMVCAKLGNHAPFSRRGSFNRQVCQLRETKCLMISGCYICFDCIFVTPYCMCVVSFSLVPVTYQYVSNGYLMYPCDELIHISKIVEKCFTNFYGDYFSQGNYVIQKVITLVNKNTEYYQCIPDEVLQCLVRTRTTS